MLKNTERAANTMRLRVHINAVAVQKQFLSLHVDRYRLVALQEISKGRLKDNKYT